MATDAVIRALVDRAVGTARVDPDAPTQPYDERCAFDPEALDAVLRLCDSDRNAARVVRAVDEALSRAVAELEGDLVLAATVLRERVTRGSEQRVIRVENIQGDVGTGEPSDV